MIWKDRYKDNCSDTIVIVVAIRIGASTIRIVYDWCLFRFLTGSPHRSSPLRLPRAGLNNNYQGLLESENNNNNNNNNYQGNTNNSTVLLDSLDWRIAIGR